MKDRAGGRVNVVAAKLAAIGRSTADAVEFARFPAFGALGAVGEEPLLQMLKASVVVWE